MTDHVDAAKRDEVLSAFHRDCPRPSLDDIIEWTQRYPNLADDIRGHAAILRDWAEDDESEEETVDEVMLARAESRALNAIFKAQAAAQAGTSEEPEATFETLLSAVGITPVQLSKSLDVGRDVIADLFSGRMLPPVGRRLVDAIVQALKATERKFDQALTNAVRNPKLGHARAASQPSVVQRSYEEIIQSSSMSPERKAYWLEDS